MILNISSTKEMIDPNEIIQDWAYNSSQLADVYQLVYQVRSSIQQLSWCFILQLYDSIESTLVKSYFLCCTEKLIILQYFTNCVVTNCPYKPLCYIVFTIHRS